MTTSRSPAPAAISSSRFAAAPTLRLARQRVVGAEHLDPAEAAALVAADGDRPAVEAVAEDPLERRRRSQRGLAGADDQHPPLPGRAGGGRRRRSARRRSSETARSVASKTSQAASPAAAIRSASRRASRAPRASEPVDRCRTGSGAAVRRSGGWLGAGQRPTRRPPGRRARSRGRRRWRRAPRRSGAAGCTWRCARRGPGRRS